MCLQGSKIQILIDNVILPDEAMENFSCEDSGFDFVDLKNLYE